MNIRTLRSFLFVLLAGMAGMAHAQDGDPGISPDKLKEIKAQKSAFITQRMHLTTEEARTFWPIYDRYEAEKGALRKQMRDGRSGARMKEDVEISEADASKMIDQQLANQQQELDLKKRYSVEFKKSIGAVKTLALDRAERDFNRELLKRIRSQGGNRGKR